MYLEQIRHILVNEGYETITASSGKEALEKARTIHPDLIFMDVVMPEMDGFAACRELTKDCTTKQIPIIFVSSKNTEADRVWANFRSV